jgi:hypothetical protein
MLHKITAKTASTGTSSLREEKPRALLAAPALRVKSLLVARCTKRATVWCVTRVHTKMVRTNGTLGALYVRQASTEMPSNREPVATTALTARQVSIVTQAAMWIVLHAPLGIINPQQGNKAAWSASRVLLLPRQARVLALPATLDNTRRTMASSRVKTARQDSSPTLSAYHCVTIALRASTLMTMA